MLFNSNLLFYYIFTTIRIKTPYQLSEIMRRKRDRQTGRQTDAHTHGGGGGENTEIRR